MHYSHCYNLVEVNFIINLYINIINYFFIIVPGIHFMFNFIEIIIVI